MQRRNKWKEAMKAEIITSVGIAALLLSQTLEPASAAFAHRGSVHVGPRGRTVVRGGGWARPGNYWWRPGGAVAAGAAIGFVAATTAVAWAGAAPGPNMCWYYTDPSRTAGFWDACP